MIYFHKRIIWLYTIYPEPKHIKPEGKYHDQGILNDNINLAEQFDFCKK